jgi:hypothetical protein
MHESFSAAPCHSTASLFLLKPLKMCALRGDSHNVLKVDGNQITISRGWSLFSLLPLLCRETKSHFVLHKFLMEFSLSGREGKKTRHRIAKRTMKRGGKTTASAGTFLNGSGQLLSHLFFLVGPLVREQFALRP